MVVPAIQLCEMGFAADCLLRYAGPILDIFSLRFLPLKQLYRMTVKVFMNGPPIGKRPASPREAFLIPHLLFVFRT